MNIRHLNHQSVCILGFGMEGRATLAALRRYAPEARITVADQNTSLELEPQFAFITGPGYLDQLDQFDVIVKSPGIPWHPQTDIQTKLTSATEIFLDSLPTEVTVIGITGTKGKSTTANLIHQVLQVADKRSFLAGNIGRPMLELLDEATPGTHFVLELSSYQLENLRTSPHIAVVTSFFPDHLDYHGSLKDYHRAKMNITRYQSANDIVFYNPNYPECREIAELSPGRQVPFQPADFAGHNPHMAGTQNQSNLAAAYHVARYLDIPADIATSALNNATGLPHRQELVGEYDGIFWVDDSAATTPQSTLAALEALGDNIDTIIVGGLDRSYDFAPLGQALATAAVRNIILLPDTGAKIRAAVEAAQPNPVKQFFDAHSMPAAVNFARQHTTKGKTALLSSGSPSYNLFKNYPERGRAFREAVISH